MTTSAPTRQVRVLAVPGARFELLDGCRHFPMVEDPDRVTRLVHDFLAVGPRPARHSAAAPVPRLEMT